MTTSNTHALTSVTPGSHALPRTLSEDDFEGAPSRFKSWIVSALCLAGAAAGGYLLYLDLNEVGQGGLGKPVGKVQKKEHKVRRKSSASFVWTQVLPQEDLFRKDSVQTGENSAASITLANGTSLDIGESSLVVMDDTTELALGFIRGTVVLHKAEGDTKISVDKEGKRKVEELPARLLRPESLAQYFVSGAAKRKVDFRWDVKSVTGGVKETLELSTQKKFPAEATQRMVPSVGTHAAEFDLAAGTYFWRVQTAGSGDAHLSDVRLLRVTSVNPVRTIYPNVGQAIAVTAGDSEVQFRWVNPPGSDTNHDQIGEHILEVATTGDFLKPIASTSVLLANGLAALKGLPAGKLYWRMRSRYNDLQLNSEIKTFDLTVAPAAVPQAPLSFPVSATPEAGAVMSLMDEKAPPEAKWSPLAEAKEYEVTLFQGEREIAKIKVKEPAISLKNLKPGDYAWTVRGVGDQRVGEPLPIRPFKLTYGEPLAAPQVMSPEVQ